MSDILDVRTEDGGVAAIDSGLISGTSLTAEVPAAGSLTVDTGYSPSLNSGGTVTLTYNGYDASGPETVGGMLQVVLRRTSGGVTTDAGSATIGAKTGDSTLVSDTAVSFGVSVDNTLTVTFNIGAYANAVVFKATLNTGVG